MDDPRPGQTVAAAPPASPEPTARGPLSRGLFLVAGSVALGLGLLGIVLPLLPTTPLLLLAAACYARASRRVYDWLLERSWAGPIIRQWRAQRTVPRRAKVAAISLVAASFSATFLFVPNCPYGYTLLGAIALGLVTFLGALRTA